MEKVTVQFYKHPATRHWGFSGGLLGEDRYGRWVGLPVGSPKCKGADVLEPTRGDAVLCFPHHGWWVLHYVGSTSPHSHFVDISTQPVFREGCFEMTDLDLDVLVSSDGTVSIEDEDEFEAHQVELGYSQHMIERALAETEWVADVLHRREEPFYETAESWLMSLGSLA